MSAQGVILSFSGAGSGSCNASGILTVTVAGGATAAGAVAPGAGAGSGMGAAATTAPPTVMSRRVAWLAVTCSDGAVTSGAPSACTVSDQTPGGRSANE